MKSEGDSRQEEEEGAAEVPSGGRSACVTVQGAGSHRIAKLQNTEEPGGCKQGPKRIPWARCMRLVTY
jgi:hypothetical protein